ncbi:MAG: ATP-dependent zinc metalloprotease FtsH [Polyangia bacterium]
MDRPFFPLAAQLVRSVFRQTQSADHRISDEQNHLLWAKSSSPRPTDGRSDKTPIGKPSRSGLGGPDGNGSSPKLWLFFLLLMMLVGLPRLIGLSEKRVSFDQFAQLVEQGKLRRVGFQVDTIVGEGAEGQEGRGPQYRTGRLETAERDLVVKLNEKKIPYDAVSTPSLLVTIGSWVLPMVMLFFFANWLMRRGGGIGGLSNSVFNFGKNKAQEWGESGTGVTFSDVAGQREAKAELVEIIDFLTSPERYTRLGGHIPRGVILVGPPGTGKTLLARAVAGEAKVPFFSISGSEFVEMFVGVGAARVRDLFAQAKEKAPSIIFIDELDAIGRARGVAGPVVTHEEREQTLDQLLTEMDGFDSSTSVIIMAATNRPEILDPALLRAGRFDRRVVVDRPTLEDRVEILEVHARKVVIDKSVKLEKVAAMTAGLVGADLANLVNEAALLAARRKAEAVADIDFQEALERVVAGLERKSRRLSPKDKQVVAYHECGHALVATKLASADEVKKISIVPRGVGALGYTMQQPSEKEGDRYLLTRGELLDRIAVLLGGRAAEEELLSDISTGAQDDLQRATQLVRRMCSEFGMSQALGLQAFDSGRGQFLDVSGYANREVSDETARAVDQEVRAVLDAQYDRVRQLVRTHRASVEQAVKELQEHEVLDGERFREIVLGDVRGS